MSSLMDALLLEPPGWRVTGVFIAKRTDRSQGFASGTQTEPDKKAKFLVHRVRHKPDKKGAPSRVAD